MHHEPVTATLLLVPTDAEPAPKAARGYRCPPSNDPGAPAWARRHGMPEPVPDSVAAEFMDHWCSIPASRNGTKNTVGWQATWRNRLSYLRKGGRRGDWKQEAVTNGGTTWQSGETERKAEEIP